MTHHRTDSGYGRTDEISAIDRRALVVFSGVNGLWWLQGLRPGFRHCFAVVFQDDTAIVCDPLSNRMVLAGLRGADPPLLRDWYREQGFTVVEVLVDPFPPASSLLRPFTCVEAVKRILGIRAPGVLTPWQLYRHLRSRHGALDPNGA